MYRTNRSVLPLILSPQDRVPLIDQDTLMALADQLENPSAVKAFILDFIHVWDERFIRLADTVSRRDHAAAMEAVLSVRTSSMMVGAARLASLASALEESIQLNDLIKAADILPLVEACGIQTIRELALCSESVLG
ncbi:hypothetical protein [Arthrobacter sp. CAL618]|uniref:hypothetical protein n=1 Tax=Arthrobacter sp. CAL618 TaxID=1055770 RepID=UPI000465BDE5|nr:hypothetical protein [Arthrobacter sp. CAL618]